MEALHCDCYKACPVQDRRICEGDFVSFACVDELAFFFSRKVVLIQVLYNVMLIIIINGTLY